MLPNRPNTPIFYFSPPITHKTVRIKCIVEIYFFPQLIDQLHVWFLPTQCGHSFNISFTGIGLPDLGSERVSKCAEPVGITERLQERRYDRVGCWLGKSCADAVAFCHLLRHPRGVWCNDHLAQSCGFYKNPRR